MHIRLNAHQFHCITAALEDAAKVYRSAPEEASQQKADYADKVRAGLLNAMVQISKTAPEDRE